MVTIEQVLKHLATLETTPKTGKLVERVMDKMGVELFAKANMADCLAAYRAVRPNSSVDLGKTSIEAIKSAQRFIATVKYDEACKAKSEAEAKAEAARRAAEVEAAPNKETETSSSCGIPPAPATSDEPTSCASDSPGTPFSY